LDWPRRLTVKSGVFFFGVFGGVCSLAVSSSVLCVVLTVTAEVRDYLRRFSGERVFAAAALGGVAAAARQLLSSGQQQNSVRQSTQTSSHTPHRHTLE